MTDWQCEWIVILVGGISEVSFQEVFLKIQKQIYNINHLFILYCSKKDILYTISWKLADRKMNVTEGNDILHNYLHHQI
jgi:hypothetical protein